MKKLDYNNKIDECMKEIFSKLEVAASINNEKYRRLLYDILEENEDLLVCTNGENTEIIDENNFCNIFMTNKRFIICKDNKVLRNILFGNIGNFQVKRGYIVGKFFLEFEGKKVDYLRVNNTKLKKIDWYLEKFFK